MHPVGSYCMDSLSLSVWGTEAACIQANSSRMSEPQNEGTSITRQVRKYLHTDMVSHHRGLESLATLL